MQIHTPPTERLGPGRCLLLIQVLDLHPKAPLSVGVISPFLREVERSLSYFMLFFSLLMNATHMTLEYAWYSNE